MWVKIAVNILTVLLASISLIIDIKKRTEENKATLFLKGVLFLISLLLIFSIWAVVSDDSKEKQLVQDNNQLKSNIDTIKKSLLPFGLEIDKNNKAGPTANYYSIIGSVITSKNAAEVNNGHIGDNNTYNPTKIVSLPNLEPIKNSVSDKSEKPEIIVTHTPTIEKIKNVFKVTYSVQTKTSEEADKFTIY